ncbi:putative ferric reductase transmembrane component [Podospora fimiseda]|uniref:Ferric reductase transmembrane component n=1 Tax=Podospora fimiseda TaxID=252190 RepID=A0AAN7BJU8_9PEZI|nr:putative ferric reductase transmembrane component [Podospora fimiseda]
MGYKFLDLNEAEKIARRETLWKYAVIAELSNLIPVVIILLFRLGKWTSASRGGEYETIPSSPVVKKKRSEGSGQWALSVRKAKWWLGEDVVAFGTVMGQRDQWLVGTVWASWLLLLSFLETGEDYLHLTKRLGLVAVSQYPLQYLLSLKSLNPLCYLLKSSHDRVNRWHRVSARVTTFLLYLHAILYLNFFIQTSRLYRLAVPIVFTGVLAFVFLNTLITTALRPVRHFSYRLFFITHLTFAISIPFLILIHAPPARPFMIQSLLVFFIDLVSRKMDTVTAATTFSTIPGTNLIKLSVKIPQRKINRFHSAPGSHVYLNIPAAARHSATSSPTSIQTLLFEFLFNPFTVASVSDSQAELTLVARHSGGPMTSALARCSKPSLSTIPLNIEGPYGNPLSTLSSASNILLVAGGIGSTFILPLYFALRSENLQTKITVIWAVQTPGDATWAFETYPSLLNDDNIQIFVTGQSGSNQEETRSSGSDAEGGTEMGQMFRRRGGKYTTENNRKRPDLARIVDGVFREAGEVGKVGVAVCGPGGMARGVRRETGKWVGRGRDVVFWKEGFGF